jgi:hypothetical protein
MRSINRRYRAESPVLLPLSRALRLAAEGNVLFPWGLYEAARRENTPAAWEAVDAFHASENARAAKADAAFDSLWRGLSLRQRSALAEALAAKGGWA